MVAIKGIEALTPDQIIAEVDRGARFVQFEWCVSAVIVTLRRGSNSYFLPAGRNRSVAGMPWDAADAAVRLVGDPVGPIYSIAVVRRIRTGGHDVRDAIVESLRPMPIGLAAALPQGSSLSPMSPG
jgi:hypothetical protein